MRHKTLGAEGFVGAVVLAIALSVIYYFSGGEQPISSDLGLCLPSPNLWKISRTASWILNLVLILVCGLSLHFLNKRYSLIQSADMVLPSMFIIMTASNPWAEGALGSSSLMALANILCLTTIFGCYKIRNATQQVFVVATMLSLGSMFQYAFIFLIPGYILIALMIKCFRLREITAFMMGLIAPYWIAIGMGIVPPESFHLPTFTYIVDEFTSAHDILIGGISIGITALVAILLGLNNSVKLYAGNTKRRLYNNAIAVIGLICVIGMAVDFKNLPTYLASFYMTAAVQIANTFALWNIKRGALLLGIITLLYVGVFLAMVF